MTSNARFIELPSYFTPRDLFDFYKVMEQKPSVEIIKQNCTRYEYNAKEIKELCDLFSYKDFEYRKIRNEVYDANNPLAQVLKGSARLIDQERVDRAWKHIQDLHFRSKCYGNVIFGCPRLSRIGRENSMWHYAIPKSKLTRPMVARLLLIPNLYIMVNTSRTFARKNDEVVSINALYLDIDNVQDVDGFIQKCKDQGRFDKVEPSKVIASGGGLHMYFYLENAYAKEKLVPYINRIQKALHKLYPEADSLSDLVRFLRLDGSTYDKPNKKIKVVQTICDNDQVYTVPEIGPKLVEQYERKPKKKKEKDSSVKVDKPHLTVVPEVPLRELEHQRLRDIKYLFDLGHFDNDRRKRAIFFCGLFAFRSSWSFAEASAIAYSLNEELKHPLRKEEVESQLYSVKHHGSKYRYSRARVVKELEIDQLTRNQQEGLSKLVPDMIYQERRKVYNKIYQKKSRRNKKGLTSRKAAKLENYNKVKSLLQQGLKQKDIAIKTGLSKSRVSEIVKQIKQENK